MKVASPDTYSEGYIVHLQPEPTHKIYQQQQKHQAYRYLLVEHFSNDHKEFPKQYKNRHKLCNETGYSVLSFRESQWKLRK